MKNSEDTLNCDGGVSVLGLTYTRGSYFRRGSTGSELIPLPKLRAVDLWVML
jgi:hypothetical protein